MNTLAPLLLTPRQATFTKAYTNPVSISFGNCYQSAVAAGYSYATARNLMHLKPHWLSEIIGNATCAIKPEELTAVLSNVIYDVSEPTVIKLKAIEMMMRYHGMLSKPNNDTRCVTINVDLSGA